MANAWKKDTIYIDTTGDFTVNAIKPTLWGLLITPSAENSIFSLKESSTSGVITVHVIIEPKETRFVDFSGFKPNGVELTTTFHIATLTNITNVLLYGRWKSSVGDAK